MEHPPAALLSRIAAWPEPAQAHLWRCRTLFHEVAAARAIGPLSESLKWGQPAWRPARPRTGSTLRLDWSAALPDRLCLLVDCKTDLAARLAQLYPALGPNDLRRRIALRLDAPFPEQAIAHLAEMTFTYHLRPAAPRLG